VSSAAKGPCIVCTCRAPNERAFPLCVPCEELAKFDVVNGCVNVSVLESLDFAFARSHSNPAVGRRHMDILLI
jgi:hypothetical protein